MLLTNVSHFTDDTYMTFAIAAALIDPKVHNQIESSEINDEFQNRCVEMMRKIGRYFTSSYGDRFQEWLDSDDPKPYNSYGNGSAMRVSPVGWASNDLSRVRELARLSAEVTHNHPEGIKGAEAIASAIFLARTTHDKEEIKTYIEQEFGYDLNRTCSKIRKKYMFDETCQGSVPEAIICFLESTGFEDAIRTAISIGGDSDTIAAMTGSIAEAFYDPEEVYDTNLFAQVCMYPAFPRPLRKIAVIFRNLYLYPFYEERYGERFNIVC